MSVSAQTLQLTKPKNVLFATDLGEDSQAAIPYVSAIAAEFGSAVHVLHVLQPEPMLEIPLDIPPELDSERRIALSKLKKILAKKPFGDARTTTTVERGRMSEVLKKMIERDAVDLIVVGTHGRRGLSKLFVGSVAEQILRASSCPVLTVGPHCTREQGAPIDLKTILFATDFNVSSEHVLEYALSFAVARYSRLILVHAVPRTIQVIPSGAEIAGEAMQIYDDIEADEMLRSKQEMARLLCSDILRERQPETVIEFGNPADIILSTARKETADLIVMGASRILGSTVASHIPWTIASTVVCNASCPVLTVCN